MIVEIVVVLALDEVRESVANVVVVVGRQFSHAPQSASPHFTDQDCSFAGHHALHSSVVVLVSVTVCGEVELVCVAVAVVRVVVEILVVLLTDSDDSDVDEERLVVIVKVLVLV